MFRLLDCPGQPSLAECLCLLPGLLFVRFSRLPFPFSAFGRPAAPAFCRRAARHRRLTPSERKPHRRRVPPVRRHPVLAVAVILGQKLPRTFSGAQPGSAHRGARNARRLAVWTGLPAGFCLGSTMSSCLLHKFTIGDQLFEVSSNGYQMVVKIILYLIDIDKTESEPRHRSYRPKAT